MSATALTPNFQGPTPNSRFKRRALAAFLGVGVWAVGVVTGGAAAVQPPPPVLTDTVNDFAGVIDGASRAELDKRIRALQGATGDVIAVATVKTFQPYGSIEEYAVKMFENGGRGIGQKGKDNGLLLLVAVDDRKVKFETGYDLEGIIPDGYAGETIREAIAPAFRRGAYGEGLLAAVTRLINRIGEQRGVTIPDVPAPQAAPTQRSRGNFPWILVFWIVVMLIASARNNRRRRRRYWGTGPWSGWRGGPGSFGGGGFGGGRSGGGGASGSW